MLSGGIGQALEADARLRFHAINCFSSGIARPTPTGSPRHLRLDDRPLMSGQHMIGFVRLRAARRKEARAIRENRMKIGFIGVGSIGRPMAGRLRSAGHELVVFDTNATALEAFVKEGGQRASSPRDVADKVEIILYSLPTPEVVRSVTLGRDGVIHDLLAALFGSAFWSLTGGQRGKRD